MRDGQVIILTVLTLGATMLGATTIAGLLMLYQLRQATDFANSGKAIFAADAGIEWSLYNIFNPGTPLPTFTNGSQVSVTCYESEGGEIKDCGDETVGYVRSIGSSGQASRAFGLTF